MTMKDIALTQHFKSTPFLSLGVRTLVAALLGGFLNVNGMVKKYRDFPTNIIKFH